jgi:hypothetical protein
MQVFESVSVPTPELLMGPHGVLIVPLTGAMALLAVSVAVIVTGRVPFASQSPTVALIWMSGQP